jgi:putative phage-type endonuclease
MTARVVLPHDASREEWLAARRAGIGGSDIGALLGASPWSTPLDVWADKTGQAEPTPTNDAMRVGNRLEPGVIGLGMDWLTDNLGGRWWLDDAPALLAHREQPVAQYSPDGIAHGRDASVLLEAKVTGKYHDDPPPHWVAQVQWGLGITGLDLGLLVAVNGSRARYWELHADAEWFGNALDYAAVWWTEHVIGGEMPGADPARDDLLIFRTPDPDLAVEVEADLIERLAEARAAARAAEDHKKDAEAAVKAALGDATAGTVDGQVRVTWKPSTRTDVDRDALKADGLFGKYAVTKPTPGSLRMVKP